MKPNFSAKPAYGFSCGANHLIQNGHAGRFDTPQNGHGGRFERLPGVL
jgi:hypothetical protein